MKTTQSKDILPARVAWAIWIAAILILSAVVLGATQKPELAPVRIRKDAPSDTPFCFEIDGVPEKCITVGDMRDHARKIGTSLESLRARRKAN